MVGAVVLAPVAPRNRRLAVATWTTRSPKVCCAGVGLKSNLSAGISLAILVIVVFKSDQSFSISALREPDCADAGVRATARRKNATHPAARIVCFMHDLLCSASGRMTDGVTSVLSRTRR